MPMEREREREVLVHWSGELCECVGVADVVSALAEEADKPK